MEFDENKLVRAVTQKNLQPLYNGVGRTEESIHVATLLTYIPEASVSNLGRNTGYPNLYVAFLLLLRVLNRTTP